LPLSQRLLIAVIAVVVGGGLVLGLTALLNDEHLGVPAEQGKVWSEEHQHWH
jgi:phosphotransferase system  glucose/maltose/N-acetylglucosamine-specific IIC component